jgi:hypothetical protein
VVDTIREPKHFPRSCTHAALLLVSQRITAEAVHTMPERHLDNGVVGPANPGSGEIGTQFTARFSPKTRPDTGDCVALALTFT